MTGRVILDSVVDRNGDTWTLVEDPNRTESPDGYACNMRWAVVGPDGTEYGRGPLWSARARLSQATLNRQRPDVEDARVAARAAALETMIARLTGTR